MTDQKDNEKGMILAIDIGNSTIVMGCIDDEKIHFEERVATRSDKTKIEHAMVIKSMIELNGVSIDDIKGVIISSVVPPLTNVIKAAAKMITGIEPIVVGPGVKTGLPILMDDPRTVGSDLIVAAVAASHEYGKPTIIVDVGTATTITVVNEDGAYIGGVIMPGVQVSQAALVSKTAQLLHVSLDAPPKVVGKNTIDALRSGAIYGNAACIDGMILKFKKELGLPEDTVTVATGGLSGEIIPKCETDIITDRNLLIKGMKIIYDRNVN